MLIRYSLFNQDYLLEFVGEIVSFRNIEKIKSNNPASSIRLIEFSGFLTKDLLPGISFEIIHDRRIDSEEYLEFLNSLELATEISDEELILLLPLSIGEKFEPPF